MQRQHPSIFEQLLQLRDGLARYRRYRNFIDFIIAPIQKEHESHREFPSNLDGNKVVEEVLRDREHDHVFTTFLEVSFFKTFFAYHTERGASVGDFVRTSERLLKYKRKRSR